MASTNTIEGSKDIKNCKDLWYGQPCHTFTESRWMSESPKTHLGTALGKRQWDRTYSNKHLSSWHVTHVLFQILLSPPAKVGGVSQLEQKKSMAFSWVWKTMASILFRDGEDGPCCSHSSFKFYSLLAFPAQKDFGMSNSKMPKGTFQEMKRVKIECTR